MPAISSHTFDIYQPYLPTSPAFQEFFGWATLRYPYVPPQFLLAGGLTLASAEFARRGWSVDGTDSHLGQWTLLVGQPAEGKSTSIDAVTGFYKGLEEDPPIINVNESTLAGLLLAIHRRFDHAGQRHPGLLIAHEMTAVLARHKREPLIPTIHHLCDGRDIPRTTREAQERQRDPLPEVIVAPRLGALMAMTPADLSKLLVGKVLDSATLSRINLIIPAVANFDRKMISRTLLSGARAERLVAIKAWRQMLSALEMEPDRIVKVSDEAMEHFNSEYWHKMDTNTEFFSLRKRYIDRALPMAAIHALLDCRTTITVGDISRAAGYMTLLNDEATKAFERLDVAEGVMHNVLTIERHISQAGKPGLDRSTLLRKMRKLSAKELDEAVGTSEARGKIREEVKIRLGGGRATSVFHAVS